MIDVVVMDKRRDMIIEGLENMAQYGLPHPEASHLMDVGTKPYLDYFEKELIDELISQGGATCRFFEGAYGAGKSHLMQLFKGMALRKGMIVANTDLSQSLKLEDWRQVTMYILSSMEANIGGVIVKSLPNILASMSRNGLLQKEALNGIKLPHPGFQNAIHYALERDQLDPNAWYILTRFLLGEKVGITELRNCSLHGIKGALTQRNSELVLKTVLSALYQLGVPGVMLLFDENEKTLTLVKRIPTQKQRLAANLIRRLIDGCTTGVMVGTIVVFAILPDFLETCANAYPALGQRLQIKRGGLNMKAWRVPVLPIQQINDHQNQESFLIDAIQTLIKHAGELGANIRGLEEELKKKGQEVLEHNVGMGYKRELMKVLASAVLLRITE